MIEYIDTIKPRIYDINYGGHLGHVELVELLHEIRAQFLKKHQLSEINILGNFLVMRNLNLDYLNQAFWDNELNVIMQITCDGAKIIFNYTVLNLSLNNKTAAAEAKMVLIDKNQKPIRPDIFFEIIENENKYKNNNISK